MIDDKDLLDFFKDIEFMPPNNRDPREFITDQSDIDIDDSGQENGYSVTDVSGDHEDHPDPQTYSDYYMFTDPAARKGVTAPPKSDMANKLNKSYHNKNLDDTHSFSDTHFESLEQDTPVYPKHEPRAPKPTQPTGDGSFPKHSGVRSMMEPTVAFNYDKPHDVVLEKATYIEGEVFPEGTRVIWEAE